MYKTSFGASGLQPCGQCMAFEGHALFEFGRKPDAWLQKYQLIVEVAERLLRFELQLKLGTRAMALQCLFDFLEQVSATDQEFDRLVEYVKFLAQGVFQGPGQRDHALL